MPRKASGRFTPPKGAQPKAPKESRPEKSKEWNVQESRSVRNPWVWRGILMLALLAVGVAITLAGNHDGTLAVLWLVIAAGWFATSMWLWRQHTRYMRGR
jgi:hypothetical protein